MFTTDNSEFDAAARRELNAALEILMSDVVEDIRDQAENLTATSSTTHGMTGSPAPNS